MSENGRPPAACTLIPVSDTHEEDRAGWYLPGTVQTNHRARNGRGAALGALLTDYRQAFVSTSAQVMDASMKEAGASPKVRALLRMIDKGATYTIRGKRGSKTIY